ncbi:MAG: WD40 repeat domain-containing protein, partial [Gemmataceae bacterium]
MLQVRLRWCALALLAPAVGLLHADPPVQTHRDTSVAEHSPRPRVDRHGDLMPSSALVRFGTPRFRQGDAVTALAFSPDSQTLASAGADHQIRLWEAATGKQMASFAQDWPTCLAFAPDGKSVCVATAIGTLRQFDLDGKELRKFAGHPARIVALAFSSDGTLLATASADQMLKVWEVATAKEAHVLDGHQDQVNGLAFVPGTHHLVSGSADRTLRLWNAADGSLLRRIDTKVALEGVAASSEGKTSAAAQANGVKLWNRNDGSELKSLEAKVPLERVSFSADGSLLAASSDTSTLLWDMSADKKLRKLSQGEGGGGPFALSADSKILACAGGQAAIRL